MVTPQNEGVLAEIGACCTALAGGLAGSAGTALATNAERLSRQFVELVLFLQLARARQVLAPDPSPASRPEKGGLGILPQWLAAVEKQIDSTLLLPADFHLAAFSGADAPVESAIERLGSARISRHLAEAPTEILGWAHQHLLSLRPGHAGGKRGTGVAPPPKKTAGVVYTPEYVIRYIVANALGRQLESLGLSSAACGCLAEKGRPASCGLPALRVLDPACGCGFFLLATCRYLADRWRQHGVHDVALPVAQCLHGTDVDAEAILAARRSLWLELVASDTPGDRHGMPNGRAQDVVNELTRNIRCGDALSASTWPDDLPAFDVVVGNPPYRRELNTKHLLDPLAGTSWGRQHRAPRMDLWYYFVHRGLELLKPGGRLSFIVDSYWTSSRGAAKLIAALQQDAGIEEIFSLGRARVFADVSGRHMILRLVKGDSRPTTTVKRAAVRQAADAEAVLSGRAPLQAFEKNAAQLFRAGRLDLEPPADELLAKLAAWPLLQTRGVVRQGIVENPANVTAKANRQHGDRWQPGQGVFAITREEAAALALPEAEARLLREYHDLADLGRYYLAASPSRVLIYSTAKTWPLLDDFPALRAHLQRFQPIMEARRETRLQCRAWWQLHWPREERVWQAAKLLCVQMAARPAFAAAAGPAYVPFSVNVFVPHAGAREDLDYLASLLNSRLLWKWFSHHAKRRGVGLEINGHVLAEAPIRTIDFACARDREAHGHLAELGRIMAQETRCSRTARSAADRAAGERRIAETDRAIDRAVCALYGLTDAEIAAVENADLAT